MEEMKVMDEALACMDTENNEGELTIALNRIADVMEKRAWSYERAVMTYGIRGHPYFKEFWPETRYWGDARIAREALGLPLEGE